jgi:hypothetical protein
MHAMQHGGCGSHCPKPAEPQGAGGAQEKVRVINCGSHWSPKAAAAYCKHMPFETHLQPFGQLQPMLLTMPAYGLHRVRSVLK